MALVLLVLPTLLITVIMCDVSLPRPHPLDNAGFLAFSTFAWMTPMMWSMFRNKLDISSLSLSPFDVADTSGERYDTFLLMHDGPTFLYCHLIQFQHSYRRDTRLDCLL